MGEFDLIQRFFKRPARAATVGIGDDCAIWSPRPGHQLAFSADMLVEGRHFFSAVDPYCLGHKALAVNLSDLAACGARPQAFLLSLSLPEADETWLSRFSAGLFHLADLHHCEIIGGDTTQGPLNIAITVMGEVPWGQSVLRSGAQVGDDIYVSGHLGDAYLALEHLLGKIRLPTELFDIARTRLEMPTPRVALGQALVGTASAMIDISDGLLGDLQHVLSASKVGAQIDVSSALHLPMISHLWDVPRSLILSCIFSGGDDYELAFTAPPSARETVDQTAISTQTSVTRIGQITDSRRIELIDESGTAMSHSYQSFDHFQMS